MKLKRFAAFALSLLMAATAVGASMTASAYSKFDLLMDLYSKYGLDEEGNDVVREYLKKKIADDPEIFDVLVNDILQSHDSHSMYLSREDYEASFGSPQDNNFVGVGVSFRKTYTGHTVVEVFEGSPAESIGMKAGDTIVAVDGKNVGAMTTDEVRSLMLGGVGTSVELTYRRGGVTTSAWTHRRAVKRSNVESQTVSPGVEYIRVAQMGSEEDDKAFQEIWNGLAAKDTRAVVLDLRDNPGGLITMALNMVNAMVPDKGHIYMGLRNRADQGGFQTYYTGGGAPRMNKILILVNGGTASAAEMVSGSMSDMGYAQLLGEQTYGKGVAQVHIPLPDGSVIVVTTLEMFLPQRLNYEGKGLKPDIGLANNHIPTYIPKLAQLDLDHNLNRGDSGRNITALTQRLKILGYLPDESDYFNLPVLEAVQQFQRENGLEVVDFCGTKTLARLEEVMHAVASSVTVDDAQLATAIEMAKLAAEKPAQYEVKEDGTWVNLENRDIDRSDDEEAEEAPAA